MALAAASGDRPELRNLDPAVCAKAGHGRVGEASHPGPQRKGTAERAASRKDVDLSKIPLVSKQTDQLETKLWQGFVEWLEEDTDPETVKLLLESAAAIGPLLHLYGDHLFKVGAPLNSFRHLITYAQRLHHDFRLHARVCWDYVTRWEQIEPLQHRVPLPAKVCDAITAVALSWRWFRFGLVLQICFHGILRVGEVISATREDLVLPSDLLSEHVDKFYVRVAKPKTSRRGGGRQQHVTIQHGLLCFACESNFRALDGSEKLFPFSGQTFRRRWDEVLAALQIDRGLGLTPGSVRGGAAIAAYQAGTGIQDLMWRMRLQHIGTLQHYVQEMAAENALGRLSPASRKSINAAASLLPHLLEHSFRC